MCIQFTDLSIYESELMEQFVNSSTDFNEDQKRDNRTIMNQFAGQGTVRYNGVCVRSGITESINFESPFTYCKTVYNYSWKERIKILFRGRL